MLEEIKKEILESFHNKHYQDMENSEYFMDDIIEILDKYDKQPDYKSAFEELEKEICETYDDDVWWYKCKFDEIKEKHNLGATMIKCFNCNSDMIYLGKTIRNVPIYSIIGDTYNYECSKCHNYMWSTFKEKSKYKWYKLKKYSLGGE